MLLWLSKTSSKWNAMNFVSVKRLWTRVLKWGRAGEPKPGSPSRGAAQDKRDHTSCGPLGTIYVVLKHIEQNGCVRRFVIPRRACGEHAKPKFASYRLTDSSDATFFFHSNWQRGIRIFEDWIFEVFCCWLFGVEILSAVKIETPQKLNPENQTPQNSTLKNPNPKIETQKP